MALIGALACIAGCDGNSGPAPVGVCDRTPEVQWAILERSGVPRCEDVTAADLARLGGLPVWKAPSLRAGDFAGMTGLEILGIYEGSLDSLPESLFSGLANLRDLYVNHNELTTLPKGIFSGLGRLEDLNLAHNRLDSLPESIFSGLANLTDLHLDGNRLAHLPEGIFAGLARLEVMGVRHNRLASLPEGVFSGLGNLIYLYLDQNRLDSLPDKLFSGLTSLKVVTLYENQLTSLPEGVFSELVSLTALYIDDNELASLPDGVLSGLVSLEELRLDSNPGAPFELPLQFERTDAADTAASPASVRLVLAQGAPFDMVVPLAIQGGSASSASALLSTGSIEGQVFTVTQGSPGQSTRVQAASMPVIPEDIRGIVLLAPADMVLFGSGAG